MSTETDNPNGFRFYDPTRERNPTERKHRLGALVYEAGFEPLREEFAYQVHTHLDKRILDPDTSPHDRQVLVEARQVVNETLEPSVLVARGVKRAQAQMNRAQADHDRSVGKQ